VQMWVAPDTSGLSPGYAEADITDLLVDGALVAAASGRPGVDAAVTLANRFATLHVARLTPGQRVTLPAAPFGHLYLPTGRMTVAGIDAELEAGDALRLTAEATTEVAAIEASEMLYWEMHAAL